MHTTIHDDCVDGGEIVLKIVAGLSLKNLKPRVWAPDSPHYLPKLQAVMVSYAEFAQAPVWHEKALKQGLHRCLDIPERVSIYLDNGAFFFLGKDGGVPRQGYEEFVRKARPDWYPIPQDYIPTPKMTDIEQLECLYRTMEVNIAYQNDGYVPVVHISRHLGPYLQQFQSNKCLLAKSDVALGGIVPNLLRAPKAMAYAEVLDSVRRVRTEFGKQRLHVFGVGGTATLHLAALLRIDSVDSSGWRNRAARGIVQLPGRGDRTVVKMGSWRGREPDADEWDLLTSCQCPACQRFSIAGLIASGIDGFCNRATHNLATLLREAEEIAEHLIDGTYANWYVTHIENSIYKPLIDYLLEQTGQ